MILNYISDPFVPVNSAWEARGVLSSLMHSSHRSNAHQEGFNEVVFISSFKMLLLCRSTGISRDMSKYIMVSCPVHTRSKHRLLSNNVVSASSHLGISSIMNKPSVTFDAKTILTTGRRKEAESDNCRFLFAFMQNLQLRAATDPLLSQCLKYGNQ